MESGSHTVGKAGAEAKETGKILVSAPEALKELKAFIMAGDLRETGSTANARGNRVVFPLVEGPPLADVG